MSNNTEFGFLAQQAYRAYGEKTGFKNFQGNPMPAFHDLPEIIQEAWKGAAREVWKWAGHDGLAPEDPPKEGDVPF